MRVGAGDQIHEGRGAQCGTPQTWQRCGGGKTLAVAVSSRDLLLLLVCCRPRETRLPATPQPCRRAAARPSPLARLGRPPKPWKAWQGPGRSWKALHIEGLGWLAIAPGTCRFTGRKAPRNPAKPVEAPAKPFPIFGGSNRGMSSATQGPPGGPELICSIGRRPIPRRHLSHQGRLCPETLAWRLKAATYLGCLASSFRNSESTRLARSGACCKCACAGRRRRPALHAIRPVLRSISRYAANELHASTSGCAAAHLHPRARATTTTQRNARKKRLIEPQI